MTDDPLAAIAAAFSRELVTLYGGAAGNSIAFLPGGVPVPVDGFAVNGTVQPLPIEGWLKDLFDTPLLVRPGDVTLAPLGPGKTSDMYFWAVTQARPLGADGSDALSVSEALIAHAGYEYGTPNGDHAIGCVPYDWPLPTSDGYWATFESTKTTADLTSTQTQNSTGDAGSPGTVLPISPRLWRLRAMAPVDEVPVPQPRAPGGVRAAPEVAYVARPMADRFAVSSAEVSAVSAVRADDSAVQVTDATASAAPAEVAPVETVETSSAIRRNLIFDRPNIALLLNARVVDNVTTTSDSTSLSITLQHTCVSLTRENVGTRWWDDTFLSDLGWYVPGRPAGDLLSPPPPDAPTDDGPQRIWGRVVGLVLARHLAITGTWTADATQAFTTAGGLLGPFNLSGASQSQSSGGVTTYTRDGVQVVAVLYAPLPVIPGSADPALGTPATTSTTTPAPTPVGVP